MLLMHVDPQVVSDWIALQLAEEGTPEYERLFPVFEVVWNMTRERPEEAWEFVLEALRTDSSYPVISTLSAGPLEDLLAYHGPLLIDRVEIQARADPKFASLLGGVWKNTMTDEIWRRVQSVWDRRGWDGIPAA